VTTLELLSLAGGTLAAAALAPQPITALDTTVELRVLAGLYAFDVVEPPPPGPPSRFGPVGGVRIGRVGGVRIDCRGTR
jgi:hypothetical protein